MKPLLYNELPASHPLNKVNFYAGLSRGIQATGRAGRFREIQAGIIDVLRIITTSRLGLFFLSFSIPLRGLEPMDIAQERYWLAYLRAILCQARREWWIWKCRRRRLAARRRSDNVLLKAIFLLMMMRMAFSPVYAKPIPLPVYARPIAPGLRI